MKRFIIKLLGGFTEDELNYVAHNVIMTLLAEVELKKELVMCQKHGSDIAMVAIERATVN